jgi:hypothetical protein
MARRPRPVRKSGLMAVVISSGSRQRDRRHLPGERQVKKDDVRLEDW